MTVRVDFREYYYGGSLSIPAPSYIILLFQARKTGTTTTTEYNLRQPVCFGICKTTNYLIHLKRAPHSLIALPKQYIEVVVEKKTGTRSSTAQSICQY